MKRILSLCMVAAALFATTSCAQKASSVEVSFNYEHQDGPGSNQATISTDDEVNKALEFTETITKENDTHRGMIKNVTGITK